MKKKLVAFAVTAAMVITSAVPVFAVDGWGQKPATPAVKNTVMVDTKGITTYDAAVVGPVDATGKTFETVLDLNYTQKDGRNVGLNLNYKDSKGVEKTLYVVASDGSRGWWDIKLGDQMFTGLNGIVTLQWTVTNKGVQIKAIEHNASENPVEVGDKDYIEGAADIEEVLSLNAITSAGDMAMYVERPEVLLDVTVSKPNPDDNPKVEGDEWITVEQPALGDQLWVTSLNFDKDVTAAVTGKEAKNADFSNLSRYVNPSSILWYSGDKQVGQGWAYKVKDTDRGNVITAKITINKNSGLFKVYTWGTGTDPIATFDRYAGADRYETAMAIADAYGHKFNSVVVVNGEDYPDALSATYLATDVKAPVLLVNDANEDKVADYIMSKLNGYNSTVYIVGGTSVVSDEFVAKFYKYNTERIAGADRYATNMAVLKKVGVASDANVLVASGNGYADALSASQVGPVMLVSNDLTVDQIKYIKANGGSFTVVGGEIVIPKALETKIGAISGKNVDRVYGANRYETNERIVKKYFTTQGGSNANIYGTQNFTSVVVASGEGFADALAGAAFAVNTRTVPATATAPLNTQPLILVSDGDYARQANVVNGKLLKVVGGEMSVSNELVQKIA